MFGSNSLDFDRRSLITNAEVTASVRAASRRIAVYVGLNAALLMLSGTALVLYFR